jgi:hypothetical protein
MKYLLLPFTLIVWFIVANFAIYLSIILAMYIFSFSWVWIILVGAFLYSILGGILIYIPNLVGDRIFKLFNNNRLILYLHAFFGIAGLYCGFLEVKWIGVGISVFWEESWFKTIVIGLTCYSIIQTVIINIIFIPIFSKKNIN